MADFLSIYVYPFVLLMCILGFSVFVTGAFQYYFPITCVVISITIILLLFRDPFAPADSVNYIWMYEEQKSLSNIVNVYHGDYFFSFTQYIGNLFKIPVHDFLILHSIMFYLITVLGLRLISKDKRTFIVCLVLFSLTSTFILLYTNVMRQGLALSLMVLSIGLLCRNKILLSIVISLLAIYSHMSSLLIFASLFFLRMIRLSSRHYLFLVISLPLLPLVSYLFLPYLNSMTTRMESLTSQGYNNSLVYIKLCVLYFSLVLFYWFSLKNELLNDERTALILKVYICAVGLSFIFIPALLISSRYIYYAGGVLPVLYSIVLCNRPNNINVYVRFLTGFILAIIFGLFVYSFDSTRAQLGI